jgi:hypothetical protein
VKRVPRFDVLVRGRSFRIELDEGAAATARRMGFYVWRCVSARSAADAERRAIEAIRGDPKLRRTVRNPPNDAPVIEVEKIARVAAFAPRRRRASGLVFYPEDAQHVRGECAEDGRRA